MATVVGVKSHLINAAQTGNQVKSKVLASKPTRSYLPLRIPRLGRGGQPHLRRASLKQHLKFDDVGTHDMGTVQNTAIHSEMANTVLVDQRSKPFKPPLPSVLCYLPFLVRGHRSREQYLSQNEVAQINGLRDRDSEFSHDLPSGFRCKMCCKFYARPSPEE